MSGIALVAPLRDLNPAYSIAGVVKNTLDVLSRRGQEVLFLTTSDFQDKNLLPKNVKVKYFDRYYKQNKSIYITETGLILKSYLNGIDKILTHDIAFLPDYSIYAAALLEARDGKQFYHWVHSTPGKDYIATYPEVICFSRFPKSKYVFPSSGNREELTSRFKIPESKIKTIYNFKEDVKLFPEVDLWKYEYICQYPVRLCGGKRIGLWIKFLEELQSKSGKKCLGLLSLAYPDPIKLAELRDLIKRSKIRVIIVNDYFEKGNSVPKEIVEKVNSFCDLFLLSSAGESMSLIWMEAMLSKQTCVVQETIECVQEFKTPETILCDFTSEESRGKAIVEIISSNSLISFRKSRKRLDNDWIFENQFRGVLKI